MVRKIQIIAFVLACAGLFRIQFGNDISRFHRMDPLLADGEKAVAAAFGENGTRFAVVDLRRWQEENAALKAKMGVEIPGEFLEASDLPDAMTLHLPWYDAVILPAAFGTDPIDLRQELTDLFDRYAKESYRLLAESFAVLLVLLVLIFRKRFFSFVAPIAAAVLATAGMLGWIGEPVNFFQLLCFFVLVGLGIDYTIFHKSVRRADTSRVVLFSFLTSLVGFGMLSFTSFQVTRSMGITLGFGLLFAYLFSLSPEKPQVDRGLSPKGWAEQKEQSAGKIRIYLLWLIYRYLGKSVAKIVTFFVVLFVYPFAAAGRDALRANLEKLGTGPNKSKGKTSVFRIFLNFAWSLLDKLDACTLKKNLPKMSVSGDTDWMQGGCFLLSTHVGCIEVLPALRLRSPLDPNTQTPNNPNTQTPQNPNASPSRPIVIATVKGDIHDIGKNIVRALLENYGFDVIDLGRDVPPETIVETVRKTGCKLVGLSALMTTTVVAMKETVALLRAADPSVKTIVGGAVLTQEYADEIGADFYAKDAMKTVRIAEACYRK